MSKKFTKVQTFYILNHIINIEILIYYMIDKNKVEWRSCKVVDCPHYMVSSEGEVINKLTNYKMNPGVNRNRYVMICIRDIEGKRRVFNLGRLVLMVFKPHPL